MSYFWYKGAPLEGMWEVALSEHRDRITREVKPAYVTVLDAHSVPDQSWDRDAFASMKYSGPLYFDLDSEDLTKTIKGLHEFLDKLKEARVNLGSLRLYATGGRGFHMEVPEQMFMPKVPKQGVQGLPYIYRVMAYDLIVDTMDMKIYSGRRGRMWRTIGVERINKEGHPLGTYKVPITLEQAFAMTPAMFAELCSVPVEQDLQRDAPELTPSLAVLFEKAAKQYEAGVKTRTKSSQDLEFATRFKGQFPPTMSMLMNGEHVAAHTGFQRIALQLAIAANALGKTEDEFVKACDGLCQKHVSDSSRYSSPARRREELRRMWHYTNDNPSYTYSKGGLRSLVEAGTPTGDLDGASQTAGVGLVDESEDDSALSEEDKAQVALADLSLMEGLMLVRTGVFRRTADGMRSISNVSFRKPCNLLEGTPDGAGHHTNLGVVAEVLRDGVSRGEHTIADRAFLSRSAFTSFCSPFGGIFSGSDTQAGVVKLILTRTADKEGRMMYALHKEGLDVIQSPDAKGVVCKEVVWVSSGKVVGKKGVQNNYVFVPQLGNSSVFNPDVHLATPMQDTPDTRTWLKALFNINNPTIVAQMLGWFVSTFHKQMYQSAFSQFPLLHPNGPAGSGKTLTTLLMNRLNFLTHDPVPRSCGTVTTQYALKTFLTGSCSVPLVLDEYKPSEMGPVRTDFLLQSFRLAYNQGKGSSGALANMSTAATFKDVSDFTFSSPIAFIAETQEMQTAIVQRCLPVSFRPDNSESHTPFWNIAVAGQENMAHLGRLVLNASFHETMESRKEALTPIRNELRASFDRNVHDRQVFNLAVVLEGLNFLDQVLDQAFKGALRGEMDKLKRAIYDHKVEISAVAVSEAAKMLNDVSLMSRTEDPESDYCPREGRDYIVRDGYIELLMREVFIRYFSWANRKGLTPYYNSAEAFQVALSKFAPVIDKQCLNSPLRKNGQAKVFRLSLDRLAAEGVEPFETKS